MFEEQEDEIRRVGRDPRSYGPVGFLISLDEMLIAMVNNGRR